MSLRNAGLSLSFQEANFNKSIFLIKKKIGGAGSGGASE